MYVVFDLTKLVHISLTPKKKRTQVRIEAFQRFVLEQIQKECIVPIAPEIMARYGGDIHRGAKDASDAGTWCWCSSFRHWCSSVLLYLGYVIDRHDTHLYHKKISRKTSSNAHSNITKT